MLSIAILDYQNLSVSSPAGFLVEANGLLFMAIKSLGNMRYLKHHVIWVFSIFFRNKKTTNISGTYPYTTFHLSLSGNGWYIWSYDIYIYIYNPISRLENVGTAPTFGILVSSTETSWIPPGTALEGKEWSTCWMHWRATIPCWRWTARSGYIYIYTLLYIYILLYIYYIYIYIYHKLPQRENCDESQVQAGPFWRYTHRKKDDKSQQVPWWSTP